MAIRFSAILSQYRLDSCEIVLLINVPLLRVDWLHLVEMTLRKCRILLPCLMIIIIIMGVFYIPPPGVVMRSIIMLYSSSWLRNKINAE